MKRVVTICGVDANLAAVQAVFYQNAKDVNFTAPGKSTCIGNNLSGDVSTMTPRNLPFITGTNGVAAALIAVEQTVGTWKCTRAIPKDAKFHEWNYLAPSHSGNRHQDSKPITGNA
ncbi:hypothetical protein JIN85_15645 [Luteolibacter pohnpeiensis]|uniref:Uncharacterized protein n=1 Tax=Luteolibacter pohnpeiensis TaxID=454153 RepID=A0A934VS32_9BACT|nr:hypothetical protein [Luteolibacter pohnpeiensis]MBK1883851.1 hypothetical protein [Luteolibacter pohnpeiensis]